MRRYCTRCDDLAPSNYKFPYCKRCAGNWYCIPCRFWNWPQSDICIKCFESKRPERTLLVCTECGNKQYRNQQCNKCSSRLEDADLYQLKLEKLSVLRNK